MWPESLWSWTLKNIPTRIECDYSCLMAKSRELEEEALWVYERTADDLERFWLNPELRDRFQDDAEESQWVIIDSLVDELRWTWEKHLDWDDS